ncbi:MAG: hypothetical protein WEG40_14585 [Candidatus Rokuibacteriota bacterium]
MAKVEKTWVSVRDAWVPVAAWEIAGLSEPVRRRLHLRQLTKDDNPSLTEMAVQDIWVESPLSDDWLVAYRILSQHGAPVVGEVRVFPNEPDRRAAGRWSAEYLEGSRALVPAGGITRQVLDRIRLSTPLAEAGELLKKIRAADPEAFETRGLTTMQAPRRGRKGHGDLFYAQVVRDYVTAVEAGSPSPAIDVARRRRLGRRGPARVRDLLHEARHRGLLTPAPVRGRRGGDLTPLARALLAAAENVPANVPATTKNRPHSTPRQPRAKKKTPR